MHGYMDPLSSSANNKLFIQQALHHLSAAGKRVLITIDDMKTTDEMQEFLSMFQVFISQSLPLFFLGTGQYETIMEIQNVPGLTFLSRAPKISLGPLDTDMVAKAYRD